MNDDDTITFTPTSFSLVMDNLTNTYQDMIIKFTAPSPLSAVEIDSVHDDLDEINSVLKDENHGYTLGSD